jgi:hypothetical protein
MILKYLTPPGCHLTRPGIAGPHGAGAFPVFVRFVFEFPFLYNTGDGGELNVVDCRYNVQ